MEEIDLKELLLIFWRKKVMIILVVLIFAILGLIYSLLTVEPKYSASTTLLLVQASTNSTSTSITTNDITLNSKLIETYRRLIKSNKVIRQVILNLGLEESEESIEDNISVTAIQNTDILKISVTNTNPQTAADIANEIAKIFPTEVEIYYGIDNIDVVDLAEVNYEPYNINHKKKIAIFGAIGGIIVCACIFLKYILDNSIKSEDDVERITRNGSFSQYTNI